MYSQKIIERRLTDTAKGLGWMPEYHSVAKARQAVDALAKIYDEEEGHWIRPLNRDEIRWIRNERALVSCDHRYALTRYAHIKDWKNEIVLFEPNKAQQIVLSVIASMEDAEREIMLQILKARQLGM